MIELLLTFVAGIVYGLTGAAITNKIQLPLDIALQSRGISPSSVWGLWASLMAAVLWPVIGALIAVTTVYASARGVSE